MNSQKLLLSLAEYKFPIRKISITNASEILTSLENLNEYKLSKLALFSLYQRHTNAGIFFQCTSENWCEDASSKSSAEEHNFKQGVP